MPKPRKFAVPAGQIRHLEVNDNERIERFRRAGYGGSVSDALNKLGVRDTVFSQRFKALRQGMQLVGRALPIKLHTMVWEELTDEERRVYEERWEAEGGHPQKRMMRAVASAEPGSVLCFDCGGDMQPAHFGEMSCQVANAHGCRGMLIAGNCRDTQYVLKNGRFSDLHLRYGAQRVWGLGGDRSQCAGAAARAPQPLCQSVPG